jgi:SAM-dependent methyltransferase
MKPEVHADNHGHRDFYASPLGLVAARLLRLRLQRLWPSLAGQEILGLGHAAPYLRLWREGAARIVSAGLPETDLVPWPPGSASLSTRVEDSLLPFPDLSFDRVLLVHALEGAENDRRMLREVWRVLKDDGKLLIVAPNRRGLWAHRDSTPFGQGRPYSNGQLSRLLQRNLFAAGRRDTALYTPPVQMRLLLKGSGLWEGTGRMLAPRFAGVVIVEAHKRIYGVMPARGVAVPHGRRVLVPDSMWASRDWAAREEALRREGEPRL